MLEKLCSLVVGLALGGVSTLAHADNAPCSAFPEGAVVVAAIGGSPDSISNREITHRADRMELVDLVGHLELRSTPGKYIQLAARSARSHVDALSLERGKGFLRLTDARESVVSGALTMVEGGSEMALFVRDLVERPMRGRTQAHRNQVRTATSGEPVLSIKAQVPVSTRTTVKGFTGHAELFGPFEAVDFELVSGDVSVTRVRNVIVRLSGAGDVTIGQIRGTMDVLCGGSGHIMVTDGYITRLTVRVKGACSVEIDAKVRDAELVLDGVGEIRVRETRNKPVIRRDGVGDIVVGNWVDE